MSNSVSEQINGAMQRLRSTLNSPDAKRAIENQISLLVAKPAKTEAEYLELVYLYSAKGDIESAKSAFEVIREHQNSELQLLAKLALQEPSILSASLPESLILALGDVIESVSRLARSARMYRVTEFVPVVKSLIECITNLRATHNDFAHCFDGHETEIEVINEYISDCDK